MKIILFFLTLTLYAGRSAGTLDALVLRRLGKGDEYCPSSGPKVVEYYNVEIDLVNGIDGCVGDDFYELGKLIEEAVADIDAEIPEYRGESLKTTMCVIPEQHRRLLYDIIDAWHRKLGRYSYRGGGICRRCRTDDADRRYLRQNSDQKLQELAEKASGNGSQEVLSASDMLLLEEDTENDKGDVGHRVMKKKKKSKEKEDRLSTSDLCELAEKAAAEVVKAKAAEKQAKEVFNNNVVPMMEACGDDVDNRVARQFDAVQELYESCKDTADAASDAAKSIKKMCSTAVNEGAKDVDDATAAQAFELLDMAVEAAITLAEDVAQLEEDSVPIIENGYDCQRAQICEMSELAQDEKRDAEKTLSEIARVVAQLLKSAEDLDDQEIQESVIDDATEEEDNCESYVELAGIEADSAQAICKEAQRKTGVELQEAIKATEHNYKKTTEITEKLKGAYFRIKDIQVKLKRGIYDEAHVTRTENTMASVSEEVARIDLDIAKIDDESEKLKEQIGDTSDDMEKKALRQMLDKLKDDKKRLERKKTKLIEDAEDDLEWQKNVAYRTFDIDAARNVEQWTDRFEKALKEYVPRFLLNEYGPSDGCITTEPKVDVTVYLVEDRDDMFTSDQCED